MNLLDWLIVIIPVCGVLAIGLYSRKYIRSVTDYLAAGRICGRYVLSVGDIANALSIIGLLAYVEVQYKTGFALSFWSKLTLPLGILMGLTGYCTYRFRETNSMSLGQFLEMRYSRAFRIFAAILRSMSEIIANMIMPALAARFFMYMLDLPTKFSLCGMQFDTFTVIILICLTLAISIICMGGTLALVITDAVQGMLLYPMLVIFIIFVLYKFSWAQEIVPVMSDRAAGESFLNPYDIENLRDFNIFFLVVTIFNSVFHRASWIGAGTSGAAKSPHEQKMAGLLGTWRYAIVTVFQLIIAVMLITFMNHKNYADDAKIVRDELSTRITNELVEDEKLRSNIISAVKAIPAQKHEIGVDAPLNQEKNLDTTYFDVVRQHLQTEKNGNQIFQQFRTLFNQQTLGTTMRHLLPSGMIGLFCLLLILAMISTDDTRIFSASLTVTQDVLLPLFKNGISPEKHVFLIRVTSIGVGVIFLIGSSFMSQLDYINLFVTIVCSMWMGGCGPVMIFGLYSRFGTTLGAWSSLLSGMFLSLGTILVQRNWADYVYPYLEKKNWVEPVGHFLETVSKPLNPYIVWKMDAVKCPINSYEFSFIITLFCLVLYVVVSYIDGIGKEKFNLDRMLHRGIYNINGDKKEKLDLSWRTVCSKLIGITKEYTLGDKIIAWGYVAYAFIYTFFGTFIFVIIWNQISPWPIQWWGHYFLVVSLVVPGIVALFSFFWFTIGGTIDMFHMFRDLENRVVNHLDNGSVEGNVSLADKEHFSKVVKSKEKE